MHGNVQPLRPVRTLCLTAMECASHACAFCQVIAFHACAFCQVIAFPFPVGICFRRSNKPVISLRVKDFFVGSGPRACPFGGRLFRHSALGCHPLGQPPVAAPVSVSRIRTPCGRAEARPYREKSTPESRACPGCPDTENAIQGNHCRLPLPIPLGCDPAKKSSPDRTYAVGRQTGRLRTVMARFACGSMVRFFLVPKKIHNVNFFGNKIENFPPCRRRYPPPNAGSPDPWQHQQVRAFRSFRGVRGPNAHRVSPVT